MPSVLSPQLNARALQVSGLPGATSGVGRFAGCVSGAAPTTGTFAVGDFVLDLANGTYWVCLTAGSPGSWTQIGVLSNASPQPVGLTGINPWGTAVTASRADHVHTLGSNPIVPLGIVAYNTSTSGVGTVSGATETIIMTTTAALSSVRCYEVVSSNLMGQSTVAGDYLNLFIRRSAAGAAVTITSTIVAQTICACPVANQIKDDKGLYILIDAPATGTYQFGLTESVASGSGAMGPNINATRPLQLIVRDVGPALSAVS